MSILQANEYVELATCKWFQSNAQDDDKHHIIQDT